MAWAPFCFAPALASWQMVPSKGFSADPTSPGFCWCCSFTQLWPWVSLKILGTFKSCLESLLCGSDRPIGQLTRVKSSRGTQCNFPVRLPIPLLALGVLAATSLSFAGLQARSHPYCPCTVGAPLFLLPT